jgi:hypothetical protein
MQALRAPAPRSLARSARAAPAASAARLAPPPARRAGAAKVLTAAPLPVHSSAPRQATLVRAAADPLEG